MAVLNSGTAAPGRGDPGTVSDIATGDGARATNEFRRDVVAGLSATPRSIPSKYLYDAAGSELFERICELPEYYLTRTELAILSEHLPAMAALLGPRCIVVEPGAGSGLKTHLLLAHLDDPVAYVPVDISPQPLEETAHSMAVDFPAIEVLPVCADYFSAWTVPQPQRPAQRTVAYFPGSTIGNMEPDEARAFLERLAQACGAGGGILIGVDLRKDPRIIQRAYNDSAGVTRQFNLNLVARMRRELGASFEGGQLEHLTFYNELAGRNESYLATAAPLRMVIPGAADTGGTGLRACENGTTARDGCAPAATFELAAGERILVEHSYKYSLEGFAGLAAGAGLSVRQVWMDEQPWFSVQYLVPA